MPIWSIMDVAPFGYGRIAGESASGPARDHDVLADIVDVAKDIVVPEAQDGPVKRAACSFTALRDMPRVREHVQFVDHLIPDTANPR